MKLIKRNELREYEKHKVESPFFATSKIRHTLDHIKTTYNKIEGLDRFQMEYKSRLSTSSYARDNEITSILQSQEWYFLIDNPTNPLFRDSSLKNKATGAAWEIPPSAQQVKKQPTYEYVESPLAGDGLTVYLGGAGMDGEYIESQVSNLRSVGIKGTYAGKLTEQVFADAAAVLKYRYPVRSISGFSATGPFKTDADWSLSAIGINRRLPKRGQFNLIGYSWGSLVAAQSAIFHADSGQIIDHLVLIGSPISQTFLDELSNTPKIRKLVVLNLTGKGDKIFAGMSDADLIESLPSLAIQMTASQLSASGKGHFFYGAPGLEGDDRRHQLAKKLRNEGLE